MKLIKLTCPNCGAKLQVSSDEKIYNCNYCRTDIIIDDETIKVEHTLKDQTKEEKIKIAMTYLEDFKEYDRALTLFEELSEAYPYEASIWFCLVRTLTENFTNFDLDENGKPFLDENLCQYYFDNYCKVEKNSLQKEKNGKLYYDYINKLNKHSIDKIEHIIKEEEAENEYRLKIVKIFVTILIIGTLICTGIGTITNKIRKANEEKYKWSAEVYFNDDFDSKYELKTISQDSLIVAHVITTGGRKNEEIELYYKIWLDNQVISEKDFSFIWTDKEEGYVYYEKGDYEYGTGKLQINIYSKKGNQLLGSASVKIVK